MGKEYVGVALGRRVRADGKRIYVSDEKVGGKGIAFRDGYVEFILGAHTEKEKQILVLTPTGTVDVAATARVWMTDDLKLVAHLFWHATEGDNLGGKSALTFVHDQLIKTAEQEAKKLADKLSELIRAKAPQGVSFHVDIAPGR